MTMTTIWLQFWRIVNFYFYDLQSLRRLSDTKMADYRQQSKKFGEKKYNWRFQTPRWLITAKDDKKIFLILGKHFFHKIFVFLFFCNKFFSNLYFLLKYSSLAGGFRTP